MLGSCCKGASLRSRHSSAAHTASSLLSDKKLTNTATNMMVPKQPRSPGFSMRVFKLYPEIIPLVGIVSAAMVGLTVWSGYALFTKTDVKLNRSGLNRWEEIDVNKPQKLLTVNERYGEDPTLSALRKELAEAYKGQ